MNSLICCWDRFIIEATLVPKRNGVISFNFNCFGSTKQFQEQNNINQTISKNPIDSIVELNLRDSFEFDLTLDDPRSSSTLFADLNLLVFKSVLDGSIGVSIPFLLVSSGGGRNFSLIKVERDGANKILQFTLDSNEKTEQFFLLNGPCVEIIILSTNNNERKLLNVIPIDSSPSSLNNETLIGEISTEWKISKFDLGSKFERILYAGQLNDFENSSSLINFENQSQQTNCFGNHLLIEAKDQFGKNIFLDISLSTILSSIATSNNNGDTTKFDLLASNESRPWMDVSQFEFASIISCLMPTMDEMNGSQNGFVVGTTRKQIHLIQFGISQNHFVLDSIPLKMLNVHCGANIHYLVVLLESKQCLFLQLPSLELIYRMDGNYDEISIADVVTNSLNHQILFSSFSSNKQTLRLFSLKPFDFIPPTPKATKNQRNGASTTNTNTNNSNSSSISNVVTALKSRLEVAHSQMSAYVDRMSQKDELIEKSYSRLQSLIRNNHNNNAKNINTNGGQPNKADSNHNSDSSLSNLKVLFGRNRQSTNSSTTTNNSISSSAIYSQKNMIVCKSLSYQWKHNQLLHVEAQFQNSHPTDSLFDVHIIPLSSNVLLDSETIRGNLVRPGSLISIHCNVKLSIDLNSPADLSSEPIVHLIVVWSLENNQNQNQINFNSNSFHSSSQFLTSLVLSSSEFWNNDLYVVGNGDQTTLATNSTKKSEEIVHLHSSDLIIHSQVSNLHGLESMIRGYLKRSGTQTLNKNQTNPNNNNNNVQELCSEDNQTLISLSVVGDKDAKLSIKSNSSQLLENIIWNLSKQLDQDVVISLDPLSSSIQSSLSGAIDCFVDELEFIFESNSTHISTNQQTSFIQTALRFQTETDTRLVRLTWQLLLTNK